ncbi:PREDICTED: uncharacterized acetyltransferase At3g50280 [Nelumbo nucifera]|uniref:Uncharacterized acetyltransferase At3g50280 n=2 Tax=Nelumbo nucifera TaxID=4432 RepID=A0A1U8B397_NELNU|nr:PREDICTED: uncharacterized acetyltransferase At3g50280 [Nelumbo nucifera]DAD41330.1 TPA_asm: hypothetical protein HUJ06_015653 [Nelumbo nucifera]
MTTPVTVRHISRCSVKPAHLPDESSQPYYLNPWDLAMLTVHYIQKGLLFAKPPPSDNQDYPSIDAIINRLKHSLSRTLVHFFPLAGRFVTVQKRDNPPPYTVFVDCKDSPGAEFIHAVADVTVADVLSPIDVPHFVQSFFTHDGAVNHDGHTMPLLAVQVTELLDGVFVGCSFNHTIGDGTSFWHFFNTWAELTRDQGKDYISRPPVLKRWFPDGQGPIINLPFTHHSEFIDRYRPPPLRERIFHFSPQSLARLKARANAESKTTVISTFQSLCALVWRSVTRVRNLPSNQKTSCRLAINNRTRLNPPISPDYFGNCIQTVSGTTTAGELLSHDLGWAAWMLHQAVVNHTDSVLRSWLETWMKAPSLYQIGRFFDPYSVMIGSSPRFDMYGGNDFGWGQGVAIRSGFANKFDGKVSSFPGKEGGGSVDLEVCLSPEKMSALESDEEFMEAVSLDKHH